MSILHHSLTLLFNHCKFHLYIGEHSTAFSSVFVRCMLHSVRSAALCCTRGVNSIYLDVQLLQFIKNLSEIFSLFFIVTRQILRCTVIFKLSIQCNLYYNNQSVTRIFNTIQYYSGVSGLSTYGSWYIITLLCKLFKIY